MALSYYQYQAYNTKGVLQTGEMSAETEQEVVTVLKQKKLIPVNIIVSDIKTQQQNQKKGISKKELIEFTQGLSTLIDANIPLDRTLLLLEELTEEALTKQLVESLRRDVKEGKSLAQAMESKPETFTKMYISMIRAGEEGGILAKLLPSLERFLTEAEETRNNLMGAMIYPSVLFVVGIASIALMLGFVVPQFATLFEDAGSNIPASAAFLLFLSAWVQSWGWILAVIPIAMIYLWKWWGSDREKKKQRDQFLLDLPLMGNLLRQQEAATFARTLGALLDAGIPLLKGFRITHGVIENSVIADKLKSVEKDVTAGISLGKSLDKHRVFPILLSRLVVVGEETGRTAAILNKLAETFDGIVKNTLSKMVSLVEPLLIVTLGILVGGIVITMLMAVFSINDIGM
ncbi:MAG: type II secretion system F family protein [Pseudomonadota bacterium]